MDFFIKYKKIFLIISFILLILILGYLLYYIFFKPSISGPSISEPASTTTPTGLPIAGEGSGQIAPGKETTTTLPTEEQAEKIVSPVARGGLTKTTQLNQTPSLGTTLGNNGNTIQYYDQTDGRFYRVDKNGKITSLSDKVFYDVENITWAPNKEKAILEYPDGSNIVYDFTTGKQVSLPKHWENFDFSPNSDKIVTKSLGLDVENRWLAVSNDDGSNVRAIEALGENEDMVYPSWSPNGQTIAMYTKDVDFNRQEVFFIGLNDENFKSMIIEGRGFQYKWAAKGDRLLYSVYSSDNNMKPMLWIAEAQGNNIGNGRKNLKVETWAEKCTFATDTELYCAVPNELEEGAGIFPEMALNTEDKLYKIDTQTGLKKLIATPSGTTNMTDLILSEDGRYLYFTDQVNQTIGEMKLK